MAHPFASQAKSSQKARLKRLNASAGKAHGSSSMYKATSYPKGAGTQREFTISGGKARSRPDRMAAGGSVRKRRPHATTNIIISHAGGRGGSGGGGGSAPNPGGPVPVPVPRPVPVPVGAGPAPMGPGPVPVRPPIAGGPMPAVPVRPPIPVGPPPGPPVRPPGMKAGGSVKKAANGGFLKDSSGRGYPGYPHSPTKEGGDKVSAHKKGGAIKKLQFGGGSGLGSGASPGTAQGQGLAGLLGTVAPGRAPLPAQRGAPTVSGVNQIPAQPLTVPQPKLASSFLQRPAPGTTTTFKKGGAVHDDEAQDRKLIKSMIAKEDKAERRARGGIVNPGHNPAPRGMKGESGYRNWGKGYQAGGLVRTPIRNTTGSGAGGKGRLSKARAAKSVPDHTEA